MKKIKLKLNDMIAFKSEDERSLFYCINYLKEFYGFNPPIININYRLSLDKVLNEKELFSIKPKIIKYFFIFHGQLLEK